MLAPDRSAPGRRRRGALRRRHPLRAGGPHRLRAPLRAPDVPGLGATWRSSSTSATCSPAAARSTAARTSTTPTTSRRCRRTRSSAGCSSRPTACASPRITEENLANQLDVVKNEIRVNVLNRPYGGFPWIYLPAGAVRHVRQLAQRLRRLRGPRERDRRRRRATSSPSYYAPANAVLAVGGDLDVDETIAHDREALRRHQPSGARRSGPSFAEPPLTAERRATHDDAHAPIPAVADRLPRARPGQRRSTTHLAHVLLAEVLTDGDAVAAAAAARAARPPGHRRRRLPRRVRRPVRRARSDRVDDHRALPGRRLARRGAARRSTTSSTASPTDGLDAGELDRVRTRLVSVLLRELDAVISRTLEFAKFELITGAPS